MTTFQIVILDEHGDEMITALHTGWYYEEAEAKARKICNGLGGTTWYVIMLA